MSHRVGDPGAGTVRGAPHAPLDRLNDPLSVAPPEAPPCPSYLETSQARHWMFSREELSQMRSETHAQATAALQQYVSDNEPGTSLHILSKEDELSIIRFYLLRIGRLVKAFGLPSLVEATAMTLMKRFYLRNSCMQFHPKLIMCVSCLTNSRLTSIYLASKAENYPLPLSHFCAQVNKNSAPRPPGQAPSAARGDVTEKIIGDLEFGMVQSLDFELAVHGAHRALYGLILDLQTTESSFTRDDWLAVASATQSNLHLSRFSDAEFLYTPSQIALASCWISSAGRESLWGQALIERWLHSKEELSNQLQKKIILNREHWSAKHRALHPAPQSSEDESQATKEQEHRANEPSISTKKITCILEQASKEILSVAQPQNSDAEPLRPFVDTDHVKQIDLHLRSNLLIFEKMQKTMYVTTTYPRNRKRPASEGPANAKRTRIDTQASDSE